MDRKEYAYILVGVVIIVGIGWYWLAPSGDNGDDDPATDNDLVQIPDEYALSGDITVDRELTDQPDVTEIHNISYIVDGYYRGYENDKNTIRSGNIISSSTLVELSTEDNTYFLNNPEPVTRREFVKQSGETDIEQKHITTIIDIERLLADDIESTTYEYETDEQERITEITGIITTDREVMDFELQFTYETQTLVDTRSYDITNNMITYETEKQDEQIFTSHYSTNTFELNTSNSQAQIPIEETALSDNNLDLIESEGEPYRYKLFDDGAVLLFDV